jgi:hypothetical protein
MRGMNSRTVGATAGLIALVCGLVACGGGAKSPGTCPDGTVLKGSDCVPDDSSGDDSSSSSSSTSSSGKSGGGDDSSSSSSSTTPASGGGDSPAGGSTPYDKDAVEVQLKRAARQVKGNCGSATDENGASTGPWGKTKASVVLGRNGHVKQVTLPAEYDGKPSGICAVHAFQKLIFPPYAGSSDVSVDWDIEIVQPKK